MKLIKRFPKYRQDSASHARALCPPTPSPFPHAAAFPLDMRLGLHSLVDSVLCAALRCLLSAHFAVTSPVILPGHAMILELEKEKDLQMIVRIFNAGAGVGRYHTKRLLEPTQSQCTIISQCTLWPECCRVHYDYK